MELKKRNMINYTGTAHPMLRHGYFDNCIGKNLDKSLYLGLGLFEQNNKQQYNKTQESVNMANMLANDYKAAELGQLIVNFTQSDAINNSLALRTFAYFTANVINQETSANYLEPRYPSSGYRPPLSQNVSDEQLSVFYEGVLNALLRKFDFFTAATLLQSPKIATLGDVGKVNEVAFDVFEKLCNHTALHKENKDSDTVLSFEEMVYGIFSLLSCSNSFVEFNPDNGFIGEDALIECAIDVLDSFEFAPSSNLEDSSIYLMLSYLFETVSDISSSKKFKNKERHKIFKKIHSLITKPLKLADAEEAAKFIGVSRDMVVYINYLAFQNFNIMSDKVMCSKLSASTKINLQNNLVTLLENENLIPTYLYKDITDAVYRPSGREETPSATVCRFFLKTYAGTLSRNNLLFVTKNYGLGQFKEFMTDPRWTHLFNNENPAQPQNTESNIQSNTQPSGQSAQPEQQVSTTQNVEHSVQGSVPQNTPPMVNVNEQPSNQTVQPTQQVSTTQNVEHSVQDSVPQNTPPMVNVNEQPSNQTVQPTQQVSTTQNVETKTQGSVQQNKPADKGDGIIRDYIVFTLPTGPVPLF